MKRIMHILLLLLLSVMIVWTATGFVVMQCAHTGNVTVGKMPTNNKGCEKTSNDHCMTVHIQKLAELNPAAPLHFDMQPMQQLLLVAFVTLLMALPILLFVLSPIRLLLYSWHSPPRQYLQRLTVLLI
ncbi:MAG: hypothetical protein HXN79_09210 [Prevotella pallens]|nr:hypothetical protein [Prevotella pallens]